MASPTARSVSPARALRGVSLESAATWVAVLAAAVFLVWAAIRIRAIVYPLYQNADVASAPMLAQLLPDQGSGHVTLGFYPWLEPVFLLDLTRWLPDHLAAWKALPFVLYGITIALFGWTIARSVTPRAGVVAGLAMATPAPFVVYMLGAPNQRLLVLLHTVAMAAFLVAVPRLVGWNRWKQAVWAGGLALTLAIGVSSDPLVVLAAVLPFLAAVGLAWAVRMLPAEAAGMAAAACVVGALGGRGLEALAEHYRFVYNHDAFQIATAGKVVDNAGLLLQDVAMFAHGQFGTEGQPLTGFNAGRELLAIAAIGAFLFLVVALVRSWRPVLRDQSRPVELRLLAIYWAVSSVAVTAGFLVISTPVGTGSVRYVTTLWPAVLALVLVLYGRRVITAMAVFAAGLAIVGCVELANGDYTYTQLDRPHGGVPDQLASFVEANRLDHGYASYWNAVPLTVLSDFKTRVYPIEPCEAPAEEYCPFRVHTFSSWYVPHAGERTFYLTGYPNLTPALKPPPASWGQPFRTARLGELTVYAYDYDLASRIHQVEPGHTAPGAE